MRYVAIDTKDDQRIGGKFIQLHEVNFTRAPVVKSYTMADGSPCIYTAANDAATTEILLECSQASARALASHAHDAELYFTGLNIVGNADVSDKLHCYLTGGISSELISEKLDICQVRIPVQVVSGI